MKKVLLEQKLKVDPNIMMFGLIQPVAYLDLVHSFKISYRWINCIDVIAPRKNTVGTAKAWIVSQRKVKIGYATGWFVLIIEISKVFSLFIIP